jgi:ankyrin repeat protein
MEFFGYLVIGFSVIFAATLPDLLSEKQNEFNTLVQQSRPENSAHEAVRVLLLERAVHPEFRGNTPLLQAVDNNDILLVQVLLDDQRVNPQARDSMCLQFAVLNRNHEMLALLLSRGADPRAREYELFLAAFQNQDYAAINILLNDSRITVDNHVLFAAVEAVSGSYENLDMLISHSKLQPYAKKRLLPIALILNILDAFKWLLNTAEFPLRLRNGDERQRLLQSLYNGTLTANRVARANAAFTIAVREHDVEMVAFLIKGNIGEPSPDDLIFAVAHRNVDMIRILLGDVRVDPNLAIRHAVQSMDVEIIKLFLDNQRGIDYFLFALTIIGVKEAPLSPSVVASKSLPIIDLFLNHGEIPLNVLLSWLRPAFHHNKENTTALLQKYPNLHLYAKFLDAIKSKESYLVEQLMPLVDPAAHNNEAFHLAVCRSNDYILQKLLKSGKVNPGDRDGVFLAVLVDLGQMQALTAILSHPDFNASVNNNFALRLAIRMKNLALVKKFLCISRSKKINPNIPVYGSSTLLMEAVKSGQEAIVICLLGFPKFAPTQDDLARALTVAKQMGNETIVAMLERTCRVLPTPVKPWSFFVDPARILVWLKDSIKELHLYYGADGFSDYTRIKPVAEMIQDIFSGRPANDDPYKRVPGFELLKLAYEDFMQSRQEMTGAEKQELFMRIMTTDYVPEFLVYSIQPQIIIIQAGIKRSKPEQPPQTDGGVSTPKRRRRAAKSQVTTEESEIVEPGLTSQPNVYPVVPGPIDIQDRDKELESGPPRQEDCVNNPLLSGLLAVVHNEMSALKYKKQMFI